MAKLKIRKIGTSSGINEGDELFPVESPSGYEVTPYDPEFETQLAIARKGMKAYRNTLRKLAK